MEDIPGNSMTYGFVAYIDESGDDGLKRVRPKDPTGSSEWFVLSAVVVQAKNERAVGRWQRQIVEKFNRTRRKDIHYRDLTDTKKVIACQEMAVAPLRCFVVMSNKKNIERYRNVRCYQEKNYLYWWITRLLLERVTRFCAKWSKTVYQEARPIKMVFSQRGGMSYDRLIAYLNLIRFQSSAGSLYLKTGDLVWNMVDLKMIHVLPHEHEAGLQLADVVAGAFYEAVSLDGKSPCCADYAELLLPRFYRGPNNAILEHGVKPMPQLGRMNLTLAQRRIFECAGFPPNRW